MPIRFDQPQYLWLLLLAAPLLYTGWRMLRALDPVRRWTAVGLRLAILIVLVLMLAGLQTVRWHEDLTVVAVVDQSESIRRFGRMPRWSGEGEPPTSLDQYLRWWVRQSSQSRRPDDRLGLTTFDDRPSVRVMPSQTDQLDDGALVRPDEGSDYAKAMRLAMALFPSDSGKRLLLVGDGNDTASEAEVLAAAQELRSAGIPVDVMPIDYQATSESMVDALHAPPEARVGQTVRLRVVLTASAPVAGTLFVKQNDVDIDLNPGAGSGAPVARTEWTSQASRPAEERTGSGDYLLVKPVEIPLTAAGINRFEATFEPAEGSDAVAVNNTFESFTFVHGQGKVLLVDNVGGEAGQLLPDALREAGIELEVVGGYAMPTRLSDMQRYDAIITHNLPAELVSPAQQRLLADYVNNLGGGLVMVGGPDSFGAGGWANTPIEPILPVDCQIPSMSVMPSGALVIVMDRSGSMSNPVAGTSFSQQQVANEAAILALRSLFPQDRVGVVAFDDQARWVVPLQENRAPDSVASAVSAIQPGGGTNIYPGLELAFDALEPLSSRDAAIRHVLLLTDGQSQDGDYFQIVGEMRQADITLSTVAVGDGADVRLLENLAQMGEGNFYHVRDPNLLPEIFIKEARTIRRTLIREFPDGYQPRLVASGSPITAGMPRTLPPLRGFVLTSEKSHPLVYTPIKGEQGEPIFAHWQVGLGQTAAFTSDATNRWANAWLDWPGYESFWKSTVRAVSRVTAGAGYDMTTQLEGDQLRIRVDATESDAEAGGSGQFVNFLNVQGRVITPDGEVRTVELSQTGPGVYEGSLPADGTGNYIVNTVVQRRSPGEARQNEVIIGGATRPPGPELRNFQANRTLLERIAEITGGRVLSPDRVEPDALFTREAVTASRSVRPMVGPLLITLLVLLLLDVACRRIAWEYRMIRDFAVRRVEAAASVFKSRQVESAETLGALKRRAAEVDAQLAERSRGAEAGGGAKAKDDGAGSTTGALRAARQRRAATAEADEAGPDATRKFEAETGFVASDDFAEGVGAAQAKGTSGEAARRARAEAARRQAAEQPDTSSRLRDAKRRAREKLAEEEKGAPSS